MHSYVLSLCRRVWAVTAQLGQFSVTDCVYVYDYSFYQVHVKNRKDESNSLGGHSCSSLQMCVSVGAFWGPLARVEEDCGEGM